MSQGPDALSFHSMYLFLQSVVYELTPNTPLPVPNLGKVSQKNEHVCQQCSGSLNDVTPQSAVERGGVKEHLLFYGLHSLTIVVLFRQSRTLRCLAMNTGTKLLPAKQSQE